MASGGLGLGPASLRPGSPSDLVKSDGRALASFLRTFIFLSFFLPGPPSQSRGKKRKKEREGRRKGKGRRKEKKRERKGEAEGEERTREDRPPRDPSREAKTPQKVHPNRKFFPPGGGEALLIFF